MNVDKQLVADVEQLLRDVETTHRYSMSRIYGLYNKAFGKDEKPQSCASCLIRKTRDLHTWLGSQKRRLEELNDGQPAEAQVPAQATDDVPVNKSRRRRKAADSK